MAIPIGVALLTVMLNAVVAVKVKFAPNPAAAIAELKSVGIRIWQWVGNILLIASTLWLVTTDAPLTRAAVFAIALSVATIVFVVVMAIIKQVLDVVNSIVDLQEKQVGLIQESLRALTDRGA